MNRSQKVREIYLELRRSLGSEASPADLLVCAGQIVDLADGDSLGPRYDDAPRGIPFDELPLDLLFARCGWKLVSQEYRPEDEESHSNRWALGIVQRLAEAA